MESVVRGKTRALVKKGFNFVEAYGFQAAFGLGRLDGDYSALGIIQPTPRMFLMCSLPIFLRRLWIRKSMALLSTSSPQP